MLGRGGDGLNEVFGRILFILANSPFSIVGQLVNDIAGVLSELTIYHLLFDYS